MFFFNTGIFKSQNLQERITECKIGYFRLPNMTSCHAWLKCPEIRHLQISETLLGQGAVKKVCVLFFISVEATCRSCLI